MIFNDLIIVMIGNGYGYLYSKMEDEFFYVEGRNLEVRKILWRIKIENGISYGILSFLNGCIWNCLYPPSHVYVADGVQETDQSIGSKDYEEKVRSPNNI